MRGKGCDVKKENDLIHNIRIVMHNIIIVTYILFLPILFYCICFLYLNIFELVPCCIFPLDPLGWFRLYFWYPISFPASISTPFHLTSSTVGGLVGEESGTPQSSTSPSLRYFIFMVFFSSISVEVAML